MPVEAPQQVDVSLYEEETLRKFWQLYNHHADRHNRDEMAAMERLYYSHFPFEYARKYLKIRTKPPDAQIAPFVFNRPQRRFEEFVMSIKRAGRPVRLLLPKSRQYGGTTQIGSYLFANAKNSENTGCMVAAHRQDVVQEIFNIYKRYEDHLPDEMKYKKKRDASNILSFRDTDTKILVSTTRQDPSGMTLQDAHISEAAKASNMNDFMVTLCSVIGYRPGTSIFPEGTAKGRRGWFWNAVRPILEGRQSVSGEEGTIWDMFFVPWNELEENSLSLEPGESISYSRDEQRRVEKFNLLPEQVKFYRFKLAELHGDKTQMKQEYPFTVQEAFSFSGSLVFDAEALEDQDLNSTKLYDAEQGYLDERNLKTVFMKHHGGPVTIYEHPKPGEGYAHGADIAGRKEDREIEGDSSQHDYSAGVIKDRCGKTVAVWHGQTNPTAFGRDQVLLCRYYNNALSNPEANGPGQAILTAYDLLGYRHVYAQRERQKKGDQWVKRYGWWQTQETRNQLISFYQECLYNKSVQMTDPRIVAEAYSFVYNTFGKQEHDSGHHDDLLFAEMLARIAVENIKTHRIPTTAERERDYESIVLEREEKGNPLTETQKMLMKEHMNERR